MGESHTEAEVERRDEKEQPVGNIYWLRTDGHPCNNRNVRYVITV
jgi:hypothetical protein